MALVRKAQASSWNDSGVCWHPYRTDADLKEIRIPTENGLRWIRLILNYVTQEERIDILLKILKT